MYIYPREKLETEFDRLILPLLTISDSILDGAKYNAQSSLIALRLSDLFLMSEIDEIPLFTMVIDIILDNPLTDQIWCPVEVIQVDFMQGKFELMLQPMSYTSDLDDLHKSPLTRDLGLVPTRYSYDDSQGEGAALNCPREGIVTKDLYWGNTRWEYKNSNLGFESLQGTTYILIR